MTPIIDYNQNWECYSALKVSGLGTKTYKVCFVPMPSDSRSMTRVGLEVKI